MRRMEEDEDDVEISGKNDLICLILREMDVMTLTTSFSQMAKMARDDGVEAAA